MFFSGFPSTDITEPGVDFTLDLIQGAFLCKDYVLDEKSMWPDDLCCKDQKTTKCSAGADVTRHIKLNKKTGIGMHILEIKKGYNCTVLLVHIDSFVVIISNKYQLV